MSLKHARCPAALLLVLLALLWAAAAASASPAGPSRIRPLVEGEEPATLEKPADQGTPAGSTVSLAIKGKELVQLKVEDLPEGLKAEKVTTAEWKITGTPTKIAAPATVTVTAENPGHGTPATTKFSWTVGGINEPQDQRSITGAAYKLLITGVELHQLTASSLPAGLTLQDVGSSETEWEITGTTSETGLSEIGLQGENAKAEVLQPVEFTLGVFGANNPGPQTGTVGVPLALAIKGVELKKLTVVEALPAGLELEDPVGSEFEWRIVGTPTVAGETEVELEVEDGAEEIGFVKFTFTIAAPETAPPSPQPPTAIGELTVSPAAAFSAARSTCAGVSFSTGTVATQWLLDGAPIAGATSSSYVAPRIDDGHVLACRETASAANGTQAQVTSPGAMLHEQPAQPAWPIGPASEHCSAALCMEAGNSAETPVTRTYQQGSSWQAASQVRCVSAPWTSIAGSSTLTAVQGFAEVHTVTVMLQRVTAAGVVTLASGQLTGLESSADALDGMLEGSPFAGQVAAGYGGEPFTAGELWPRVEPGSLGKPDRFVAGQGYIAYQLAATPGVKRSFQLVYNLTSADLGARLRCLVQGEDGPATAPTRAALTSPEYSVAKSSACAPRSVMHVGGPQPAVVLIGSRRCLSAQSGLAEIGSTQSQVSSVAGRSAFMLECALARTCSGRLELASAGHKLAAAEVSLARDGRRLVSLKLDAEGRSRLKRAGAGGLPVTLTLAGHGSSRLLLAAKLLDLT